MGHPKTAHEALMRAICANGGHVVGTTVNVRNAADSLDLDLFALYKSVLDLVDANFLEYLGAGPKVRVTALGAEVCGHLTPLPNPSARAE